MKVFVTGATGWVGSAVVKELIAAGHEVNGLARSKEKAKLLAESGANVTLATLDDIDLLQDIAKYSDAIIHTAFNHDFSKFSQNAEQDKRVIESLGDAIMDSDKKLIVTSGLSGLTRGANENDIPGSGSPRKSEQTARLLVERGINVSTIRLAPSVHGIGDHGFVPMLIKLAKEKGVSGYLGNGDNCWSGVHRFDAARVYRLALETNIKQPVYHAVADEAVPFKLIAARIGKQLGLEVKQCPSEHFGWFASMAGINMAVSSELTRNAINWKPTELSLLDDLENPEYYL